MSNIDLTSTWIVPNPGASPRGLLSGLALGAVRLVLFAQQRHSDRMRLHNMDDYLLKDMGLQRDKIGDALRKSAELPWGLLRRSGL